MNLHDYDNYVKGIINRKDAKTQSMKKNFTAKTQR